MPTKHRKAQVEAGYAPSHHGHDPAAVKLNKEIEKENQARLDAATSTEEADAAREETYAAKRAARAARHKRERAASKK